MGFGVWGLGFRVLVCCSVLGGLWGGLVCMRLWFLQGGVSCLGPGFGVVWWFRGVGLWGLGVLGFLFFLRFGFRGFRASGV